MIKRFIKLKKVGYVLLLISSSLAGYIANFTDLPYKNIIIGFIIISGIIGKVLTDSTVDEK